MLGVDVMTALGGKEGNKVDEKGQQYKAYYYDNYTAIDLAVGYNRYINNKQSLALAAVAEAEGIINKLENGEVNWLSWHKEDPDAWLDYGVRDVDVMVGAG